MMSRDVLVSFYITINFCQLPLIWDILVRIYWFKLLSMIILIYLEPLICFKIKWFQYLEQAQVKSTILIDL